MLCWHGVLFCASFSYAAIFSLMPCLPTIVIVDLGFCKGDVDKRSRLHPRPCRLVHAPLHKPSAVMAASTLTVKSIDDDSLWGVRTA